jgi:hypothetical protein
MAVTWWDFLCICARDRWDDVGRAAREILDLLEKSWEDLPDPYAEEWCYQNLSYYDMQGMRQARAEWERLGGVRVPGMGLFELT